MSKIIRNTLILTIITVVAGLGLGLVYEITKEPIARTEEQAKKEAWQTVFSDVSLEDFKAVDVDKEAADKTAADLGIKATVDEVCEAADEGYVVTVTDKEGYGGDIQITVGVTCLLYTSPIPRDLLYYLVCRLRLVFGRLLSLIHI